MADRLSEQTLLSLTNLSNPLVVQVIALRSNLNHQFVTYLLENPAAKLQPNFVPKWLHKWLQESIVETSERGLEQLKRAFNLIKNY